MHCSTLSCIHVLTWEQQASDVEKGLAAAKQTGLTVFRTWGFNDKNKTYIQNGMPQYGGEGAGTTNNVFQVWDNGKPTINLQAFDKVIKAAEKTGMKLIVALTNNWADYGGMDVYTVNLGGRYHDDVSFALASEDDDELLLTGPVVLSSASHQGGFQELHPRFRQPLCFLSSNHGLGTCQRAALRC